MIKQPPEEIHCHAKAMEIFVKKAHEAKLYRPVAVAIIQNRHNKILIVESAKNKNESNPPQGGIEEDEEIIDALFREIKEEVGISKKHLKLTAYLGVQDLDSQKSKRGARGFALGKRYFFFCLRYRGPAKIKIQKSEVKNYRWVRLGAMKRALAKTRRSKRLMLLEFFQRAGPYLT
ncbi:MAG: hypothetical protein G01um10143_660 [Parcubacteria group bacterium Gr01-1014_3]|nr:MAG: hypothetical protein G01um10143_660 [Parcubacteria group bacterium Gr01-1014_3]